MIETLAVPEIVAFDGHFFITYFLRGLVYATTVFNPSLDN